MALAAVLLAGLTAGCESSNDKSPVTPAPPAPPAAPPVTVPAGPQQAGQQALEVYRKMWDTVVRMKLTSDYQSPELAPYVEQTLHEYFRMTIKNDFDQGLISRGQPAFAPRIVEETPAQVRIVDCLDDTRWLKYWAANGQLEDDLPGGHHHAEATVVLTGGVWRVRSLMVQDVGTC
jgi:hypothetical protein